MKKWIGLGAALLGVSSLIPTYAQAQTTIINNNNVTVNNSNSNDGYNNGRGGGRFNDDPGIAVYWRNNPSNMEAWMRLDRSQYRAGTGIRIGLSLTNLSRNNTTYQAGSRGEYEIAIYDARSNRLVWRQDRSQMRNRAFQVNAGSTESWSDFWDQRDLNNNAVPAGTYRIEAKVMGLPLSAQVFLMDRNGDRPSPGGIIIPDDNDGPRRGGGANPGGHAPRPSQSSYSDIMGSLSVDRGTVRRGDSVRLTYTVVNTGRQTVDLVFPSALLFDVTARLSGVPSQRPVWRLSDGMAFATMVQRISLQPGERRVFNCTWSTGDTVASGQSVDLTATLNSAGAGVGQVGAARTRVTVN